MLVEQTSEQSTPAFISVLNSVKSTGYTQARMHNQSYFVCGSSFG